MAKKRGKARGKSRRTSRRSVRKSITRSAKSPKLLRKESSFQKARKEIKEAGKMKYAPLKGSLFAISLIGFLATIFLFERLGLTWGLTFLIFFVVLFIASLLSLLKGPITNK